MRWFLKQIDALRFGAMEDRTLGPLRPGLNVVFGRNEAGKTTFAQLVRGVLYGWNQDNSHADASPAAPAATASYEGALTFAANPTDLEQMAIATGLGLPNNQSRSDILLYRMGDSHAGIAPDLSRLGDNTDRATFDTLFSLTSDELMALRSDSTAANRLLAASTGTNSSPAKALATVQARLSRATQQAKQLSAQVEEKRTLVSKAAEEAKAARAAHRELHNLQRDYSAAMIRREQLEQEIATINGASKNLKQTILETEQIEQECNALAQELSAIRDKAAGYASVPAPLLNLTESEDQAVRDRLGKLEKSIAKTMRIQDQARENAAASGAAFQAYNTLAESEEADKSAGRSGLNRTIIGVVTLLPALLFAGAGVPLFIHGRTIQSLSLTVFGVGMVALGFFLATAWLLSLLRPKPGASDPASLENRRKDAQWVMLQDQSKLASTYAELQKFVEELNDVIAQAGMDLPKADPDSPSATIIRAKEQLDKAAEVRAKIAADQQRTSAINLHIENLAAQAAKCLDSTNAQWASVGLAPGSTSEEIDGLLGQKLAQQEALSAVITNAAARIAALSETLKVAKEDTTFGQVKQEKEKLQWQLNDVNMEVVQLLLTQRFLQSAMVQWNDQHQPEIFNLAGVLLSELTGGRWDGVVVNRAGEVAARRAASVPVDGNDASNSAQGEVAARRAAAPRAEARRAATAAATASVPVADGEVLGPDQLSCGTRQQLYLALRVAMLLLADNIGPAMPVVADDILVNFDGPRRAAAARVLAALAEKRQVIIFTCHEETVAALLAACPSANALSL